MKNFDEEDLVPNMYEIYSMLIDIMKPDCGMKMNKIICLFDHLFDQNVGYNSASCVIHNEHSSQLSKVFYHLTFFEKKKH